MTDDPDDGTPMWSPAAFAKQMQEASQQATQGQQELFKQFMKAGTGGVDGFSQLNAMSMGSAMFKTRVQSGGRISIPDAEREALDIEEGDIVQAIVIPVKRNR
ncbi:AbrB/MazE/SpoVT family DNA-binding domain-containing protein [Salinigranum marinum]|uniref:AbrB/MazE/SpoVT family DNA-binding domain-containing protein n=1 Tax=Salinigranum marinum TaxID=1515595 RepID=UPI002989DDE4|nr:AbrB/MazE/SpoVT family DNA-binding domain-containing protein [Salinigranum marinum]